MSQLGQIEVLEEKVHTLDRCVQDLKHKLTEQNQVIANLVGDNLDHLQDKMSLRADITRSQETIAQLEERLSQVASLVMGMVEGALGGSLSEAKSLDVSGGDGDNQDGGEGSRGTGASQAGSTRGESLIPWEGGLITEMEREAEENGAEGWFNGNMEVLESWSGHNSDTSASQDQVRTTTLTTIGSQTLPNMVRVPDNITSPAILRPLMEGPLRLWQMLMYVDMSPPLYT